MGYLLFLAFGYIVSYFILVYFLELFFNSKLKKIKFKTKNILDILIILFFYFLVLFLVGNMANLELANRLQHAIGGGFLVVLISFLSYKSSSVKLTKFQFFFFSIMIATCFGVVNELAESIGQVYFKIMTFSPYLADTWFDLWSNTIGAIFGASVFTFFVKD